MEAVVAISFPLASIVIVLYLLWNDLLRRRRGLRVLLFMRAFMCLALAAVLIFNWISFRSQLQDMPVVFVASAATISFLASIWFFYRGLRGDRGVEVPEEEPLPRIFVSSDGSGRKEEPRDDAR